MYFFKLWIRLDICSVMPRGTLLPYLATVDLTERLGVFQIQDFSLDISSKVTYVRRITPLECDLTHFSHTFMHFMIIIENTMMH